MIMAQGKRILPIIPGLEPAEIAYRLLKAEGQPLAYGELVARVGEHLPNYPGTPQDLAVQVYTDINRDGRFYRGADGRWGLQEWEPHTRRRPAAAPKVLAQQRGEKRYRQLLDEAEAAEESPGPEEESEGGEEAAAEEDADWYDNADG